jgi:hypothetical protein
MPRFTYYREVDREVFYCEDSQLHKIYAITIKSDDKRIEKMLTIAIYNSLVTVAPAEVQTITEDEWDGLCEYIEHIPANILHDYFQTRAIQS